MSRYAGPTKGTIVFVCDETKETHTFILEPIWIDNATWYTNYLNGALRFTITEPILTTDQLGHPYIHISESNEASASIGHSEGATKGTIVIAKQDVGDDRAVAALHVLEPISVTKAQIDTILAGEPGYTLYIYKETDSLTQRTFFSGEVVDSGPGYAFWDTFTDADLTNVVTSHTPDIDTFGNGWDYIPGNFRTGMSINNNEIGPLSGGLPKGIAMNTNSTDGYDLDVDINNGTSLDYDYVYLVFRSDNTDYDTTHWALMIGLTFVRVYEGTTNRVQWAVPSVDGYHTYKIRWAGDVATFFRDDTELGSWTCPAKLAGTSYGFVVGINADPVHIDNLILY